MIINSNIQVFTQIANEKNERKSKINGRKSQWNNICDIKKNYFQALLFIVRIS